MKIVRNILSILLVTAFFNVVVSKSLHELFEHNHELELCESVDLTHFHQHEMAHVDFICDFNFSASLLDVVLEASDKILFNQESKNKIPFLGLTEDLCFSSISLRGPPFKG